MAEPPYLCGRHHAANTAVQILIHQYRSLVRAFRGVHEYESVTFAGAVDEPGLGAAMRKEPDRASCPLEACGRGAYQSSRSPVSGTSSAHATGASWPAGSRAGTTDALRSHILTIL